MRTGLAIALGVCGSLVAARVDAAQTCSALKALDAGGSPSANDAPPVIYVMGSSAVKPMIAALAPSMFLDSTRPTTIVYVSTGSCTGVSGIVAGTPIAANTTAAYWDPNSKTTASGSTTDKEEACTVSAAQTIDVGASDVFAQTCGFAQQGFPQGIKDFQGPIQSMTFAVPKGSSENSISAQAAYLVFGLANLAPWTDPTHIFRRNDQSGTQSMISVAIGVPASRWTGVDSGGSTGVFNSLTAQIAQADMDKSIGILGADFSSRPDVKQLAYQHYGQTCAYKPDIQPKDKLNTRNGRYAIWGPLHLLSQVDTSGLAANLRARDLIAYLQGSQPPPLGVNLIRLEESVDIVPPCAMNVHRDAEMGPMSAVLPSSGPRCGCAFDHEATGTTTCTACSAPTDCSAGFTCSFGYCEATQ